MSRQMTRRPTSTTKPTSTTRTSRSRSSPISPRQANRRGRRRGRTWRAGSSGHPRSRPKTPIAGAARGGGPATDGSSARAGEPDLEGVLHLLARLLEVALHLLGLALGLQLLVVRRVADLLLAFTFESFGLVLQLVGETHDRFLSIAVVGPCLDGLPWAAGKNLTRWRV